jgi:predicted dithiol-disulfide oxidoreductase (DUF899 family)
MRFMNAEQSIARLRDEIWKKKQELIALYGEREADPVSDYRLVTDAGATVRLSELFGDKEDLILVHNMGRSCNYCTMWADGLASLQRHIATRCAFVVSSPDAPEDQRTIKSDRGWVFTMVSTADSTLTADLGFKTERGYMPGVSALHKNRDGSIVRTNWDYFGPFDDYNPAWHLFSLLNGGTGKWEPQSADE